ncbi:desulfoferrodoxin FeS4 iron-binding domain-containing protein, partial [Candidatus Woesearchaeota archaeon]|nr:desulfoferrodoxin FeS4 iron-binding domain-containing protein [Candidatus Woesearchaeota archaeon]
MTGIKKNEIYKCEICGNIVEVVFSGEANLVCCSQAMDRLEPKAQEEEGKEKHVPVIEKQKEGRVVVKVGSDHHPMEEDHHVTAIELLRDGNIVGAVRLNPGDKPEAVFCLEDTEGLTARAVCN